MDDNNYRIWDEIPYTSHIILYMYLVVHGPLTRYVKLKAAHAPGMLGTFSSPPTSKETSYRPRHASQHVRYARAVMHVGIANLRWLGKCSQHSRRLRNPQVYVSGERSMSGFQSIQVSK